MATARDAGIMFHRLEAAAAALSAAPRAAPGCGHALSERELAVLGLLATELSQREIGRELYLSVNTVKTHVRNIFRKLGASSREQAVERARERGLIRSGPSPR